MSILVTCLFKCANLMRKYLNVQINQHYVKFLPNLHTTKHLGIHINYNIKHKLLSHIQLFDKHAYIYGWI